MPSPGALSCWKNESLKKDDAADRFDCSNLLPLVSPHLAELAASAANVGRPCAARRASPAAPRAAPVPTPARAPAPRAAPRPPQVAATLLADWFRMDVFLGHPLLNLRVNEVTYPSHILDTGALQQWLRKYRELQVRPFSGRAVYKRVSESIGVDNSTFWDADGAKLRHFQSTGKDGITKYIMAYTRDEAWATAKDLHMQSRAELRDAN